MLKRCLFAFILIIPILTHATPLPAAEVFKVIAKPLDPNTLIIKWTVKPGYFLYKDRISLTTEAQSGLNIAAIQFPKAEEKKNLQGQIIPIYRNQLTLPIAILASHAGETILKVHFQGCSDQGFCYPPAITQIKLGVDPQLALSTASIEDQKPVEPQTVPHTKDTPSEDSNTTTAASRTNFDKLFSSGSWPLIILSFFGFGLLLAFTPCVLPMIPILSGIIVGHGHQISTRKAFFLSLSYVLSMSLTYGLVGAVIALLGSNLQIVMQSPWAICLFSLVFVLLALSMFDLYQLQLPMAWRSSLAKMTRNQSSGHYLGAALMGCMSTLILSPCVTAPLIGALGYIAQTGNMTLGLLALFFLGLGMGTPLLLVGTSAGKLLPKVGTWMNTVKAIFGLILLAMAIYLMSRLLPPIVVMVLWAALLISIGITLKPFANPETKQGKIKQGIGIVALAYGLLILYGASAGHTNPLLPLKPNKQTSVMTLNSKFIVYNVTEAMQALTDAKNNGMPAVLDFYADWCESCKVMNKTTLPDSRIQAALKNIIFIEVDLSKNDHESRELLNYFHVIAPPTFLFYNANGEVLNHLQLVGKVPTATLLKHLNAI
ncbi:MAG: protein-disulfide reductase DsbD [Legionellaceae bacterium]|nr:protein-disulfide reductase DsbD [Legionellaceae bacterium]